ncbi:polyphosphoinositide phosphatase isoform X2 [Copidosoma floridanum]|uniref:polyphosphoinositide phosphatase isoform X2 n=1 Tax=Copidosoma floridanum TaxID=29053 RepID=UPI000C6F62DB|nr:polyphosphoinositide phosphatase isoform X2 [Copidosoma floridanum]
MAKMGDRKTNSNVTFHPIITPVQKIALYETKSHFFLIGSNNTLTHFRVLKIDRTEPKDLVIVDDKIEYTQDEIRDLRGNSGGVTKIVSAFGIIGFIRFLEGYYVILITKRRRVAVIGHHTIYKIEDTTMIYVPSDSVRLFHPDEQRYVKMFQSIDLSSNFYFSYSYDLTHTLQSNMTLPKRISNEIPKSFSSLWSKNKSIPDSDFFNMWTHSTNDVTNEKEKIHYGIRNSFHRRFVWNTHLLSPVEINLHSDWILYIIHGFIGQSNISVFGRSLYVTIIARRSNKYAGTRFLKRGSNFHGDVANEVETEQIVHDSGVSSLNNGHFSSFVQMRGSVPSHWSQDVSKMVPKPTITIDLSDPFIDTAGAHFNDLLKRYGSPIIILNLVKKREKKKHESTLSEEMNISVKYLNQFLPTEHYIQYISFDMARKNRAKEANVMERLENIANNAVLKTGLFISSNSKQVSADKGILQTGIIRTNCVDCLDRTNTAQFVIGKCALGYQLYALGILNTPKLEFDTDCVRMLEELYEDHGDTLALQYGGSQLVHRIKTYRKTAPWTSQGNDIMQTLSRYYSNTFSDQEKQHTINILLGLFIPEEGKPPIWEFPTDYYLHHKHACKYFRKSNTLTQWWDKSMTRCLPYAYWDVTKTCAEVILVQDAKEEMIDVYYDYYRPYELSLLSELFSYQVSHSVRDFMPHFTTDFSPFAVRVRPGKRREEAGNKNVNIKNPSLSGQSSTSSTASSASSSMSSSDDEESQELIDSQITMSKNSMELSFEILFPPMKEVYGTQPTCPKRNDVHLYKKFVLMAMRNTVYGDDNAKAHFKFSNSIKLFGSDAHNSESKNNGHDNTDENIYKQYVEMERLGGSLLDSCDISLYERYAHRQQLHLGISYPDLC